MTQEIIDLITEVQGDVADVDTKLDTIKTLVEGLEPSAPVAGFFREYGGTLSNSTGKVLNISAFGWFSDDNPPVVIEGAATTVDLDVAGLGGLDTGSPAANTTYHVFLVRNPTTEVCGVVASATASAPTLSGFTEKRRIGSVPTDSSGDFVGFTQRGDEFLLKECKAYPSVSNPGTSATLRPLAVPTGIQVLAKITAALWCGSTTVRSLLVTSPDQDDLTATGTRFSLRSSGLSNDRQSSEFLVRTDTSGNFRTRLESSDSNAAIFYSLFGWVDARGRGL